MSDIWERIVVIPILALMAFGFWGMMRSLGGRR